MAGCVVRGYINTALEIFRDKINVCNIDLALDEFMNFCRPHDSEIFSGKYLDINTNKIYQMLLEVKIK